LFARYENSQTFGGAYGLGTGPLQRGFTVGFDSQFSANSSLYSEYRLRDAASGRDIQSAIGLRNTFNVSDGLRILTNVERLNATSGDTTALGVGLEYTASPLWKGTGRVEWRQDLNNTNVLITAGLARKLDREWTFLARDYFNKVDPRTEVGQDLRQNRLQMGFAYRPVDTNNFDALGSFENRYQDNPTSTEGRTYENVNILSLRANYHPSRPWWVTGRYAYKRVRETLNGVPDAYTAQLIGGRVTYDITNRWSVGALASVLQGRGGERNFAYGLEVGYVLMDNLWATLGYNWKGFNDRDLSGADLTNRGWVLGLRYKFDEDLFKREDSSVNKTLTPSSSTTPPQK
jgi:opacity protein-like surface antigen